MDGLLACPVCHGDLDRAGRAWRCAENHSFDVARQGYVNLAARGAAAGDDAAMVEARAEFLAGGWFDPLTAALTEAVADAPAGPVADLGAGTGHHLAAAVGDRAGVAMDASVYAARRAARAHPSVGAVVADTWGWLPLRDGAATVVMVVFAPRGGAEIARVLAPGGTLVVAAAADTHLAELAAPLGLLAVDPHKHERLRDALAPHLEPLDTRELRWPMTLDHTAAAALAAMGPSARHIDDASLTRRIAALPDRVPVTGAVTLSRWRAHGNRAQR